MGLIVRSWNVFHGNADPPRRRGYLREMVRHGSADEPDVLCLQEVPAVLAGDFDLRHPVLPGYSPPGPGIDHDLVLGTAAGALVAWPHERRVQNGVVLSDHAPVELEIG